MQDLRILFVGAVAPFLTTAARRDAFLSLGLTVETVDQIPFVQTGRPWLDKLGHWTLQTPPIHAFNRAILAAADRGRFDVAWIEKGTFVFPHTLRALRDRGLTLVYHNTDDWRAKTRMHQLHWRYLLRTLADYDVHITSNLHNVSEFRERGFPRVHHMELAANEAIAHPGPLDPAERERLGAPVGFIGHYEPETEKRVLALWRAGVGVRVYGFGWERAEHADELVDVVVDRSVWGEDYAKAILSFDVNLGIVSKWNRNHTASRTFQIPALGAFLLHERNELVEKYFCEGEEAAFFDSDEELVEKCRHYLERPEERARVAEAGRRRCHESGYFELDRVREILPAVEAAVRSRGGSR